MLLPVHVKLAPLEARVRLGFSLASPHGRLFVWDAVREVAVVAVVAVTLPKDG
jgi:hypothetical protein